MALLILSFLSFFDREGWHEGEGVVVCPIQQAL